MRCLSLTAILAVPLLLLADAKSVKAFPVDTRGMKCGSIVFSIFPHAFNEGPLYNYGPYFGYYPFKPYGPWDAYLRYDPFFYGDPYANWGMTQSGGKHFGHGGLGHGGFGHGGKLGNLFHNHGCLTCGFWHASWLHGGWFRGHVWLHGGFASLHRPVCKTCGGIGVATATTPTGNVTARYSGVGDPSQSAIFYSSTPTLDPTLELQPVAGQTK